MRKRHIIRLLVPPQFKVVIDTNIKRNRINYYLLIHYLFVKTLINKNSDDGFFAINNDYFKAITGCNSDDYVKFLRKCEIIISDKSYQVDVKRLHYKINPEIEITPGFVEINEKDKIYFKLKKDAHNYRAHFNELPEYLHKMANLFYSIDLDYDAAFEWISNNPNLSFEQKISYTFSVEMFRNKDTRYFDRNRTNSRLDTNLTNLPKQLRQFIKLTKLWQIDLKNSQPFLLTIILQIITQNQTQNTKPLCCLINCRNMLKPFGAWAIRRISNFHGIDANLFLDELSRLLDWTVSGKFYDNFISEYSGSISREQIKNDMLGILFSQNRYYDKKKFISFIPYEKEKKRFSKVFPNIYKVIQMLKEKDHSNLPNLLTKIESFIFINIICSRLYENGIIPITIHDSILVEEKYREKTLSIIEGAFIEITGYKPTFGIERVTL